MVNKDRLFLWTLVLLFGLTSCQWQIRGRLKQKNYFSLAGTVWKYTDKDWSYTIKFNADGTITSTHPNGNFPQWDTWTQRRRKVEFRLTKGYSRYRGKIMNATLIEGKARNKDYSWKWKLTRISVGLN